MNPADENDSGVESVHTTVLLQETIDGLNLKGGETVLDCTFGGGGHTSGICKKFPNVKIIALDQDKSAWSKAKAKFKDMKCDVAFHNLNFKDLDQALVEEKVEQVDAIIFDLGLSSDQLENSGRGFSFIKDEPLLMTMKALKDNLPLPEDLTAKDVVNTWSEESLADIIYGYGEERYARRIAKAIVDVRQKKEIDSTFQLVSIIEGAVPSIYKRGRLHYATRTFQAIRIAVNDELGVLKLGLIKGFEALKVGGRMSVISFHSLEDRIVKQFFKEKSVNGELKLINKKPILAGSEELKNNKRARSAKLRIIEKLKSEELKI